MGTRLPPSSTIDDAVDSPKQEQDIGAHPRPPRARGPSTFIPYAVAVLVAVVVVLPWTSRGWLLLLDWAVGPHLSIPRSFWGLDNGLPAGMPLALMIVGLTHVIGAATLSWLVIAVALMVAGVAAGQLSGGSPLARIGAGTFYAVNPLMFDRIFAGHIGYLLAYALLPMAVLSILRWRGEVSWRGMRPALWIALLAAITPHFFWIGGTVLLSNLVTSRERKRVLAWTALVAGATVVMSAYLFVPSAGRSAAVPVGEADLAAYRTRADPSLGLAVNVAGLYGFWRPEPKLPKKDVAGWPLFLGGIVLLAGSGLSRARRSGREEPRHLAGVLVVSGALGFFLAIGDQGPTGPAFRLLFDHLTGFAIMREPQKFVALLALAYAVGFGWAVDDLVRRARGRRVALAVGALAVGLPILYTPTLFFGLAGRVDSSRYPESWTAADRLMGEGSGKVLFLPWHQYLGFPFTGRIIANPADGAFRRDSIEGDNVELGNLRTSSTLTRSAYLEFLFSRGDELCAFGRLVAPLGVEYVALTDGADGGRYRPWLDRQVDLTRLLDRQGMTLYRNNAHRGSGGRASRLERVAHWGELAALANGGTLGAGPYVVDKQEGGPIEPAACGARAAPVVRKDEVTATSPVSYRVHGGTAGFVELPEAFDPSWRMKGAAAFELAGGTVGLATDGTEGTAQFRHWGKVRLGYAVSILSVTVLVAGGPLNARLRRRRG